ncbi:MAG: ribulose-phosphate 3-epimerase [Opitutales bacterium]|nr:ribulose-phosphate 3-epimerase [Opitutales bacterium]
MKKLLAPSILAGNHANLKTALNIAENDGRQWIHLDIMDGHFVPNLSFGPQTVADLRKESELFFDVHLMLDNPHLYIDAFSQAGADLITIHIEPSYDHAESIKHIKSLGKKVGIALNPSTPVEEVYEIINQHRIDLVLCMTVNPGFGGQSFIYDVLKKVKELTSLREKSSNQFLIEVDGGVGPKHVQPCLEAGVDVFVAGTAYYKGDDSERRGFAQSVGEKS